MIFRNYIGDASYDERCILAVWIYWELLCSVLIIRCIIMWLIMKFSMYSKKKDSNICFKLETSQNMKMHQILLYIWSITNVNWFNKIIMKFKKKSFVDSMVFIQNFEGLHFKLVLPYCFLWHITTKLHFIMTS